PRGQGRVARRERCPTARRTAAGSGADAWRRRRHGPRAGAAARRPRARPVALADPAALGEGAGAARARPLRAFHRSRAAAGRRAPRRRRRPVLHLSGLARSPRLRVSSPAMTPRARIGRTIAQSEPAFTPLPKPRAGAPNVVMVVLDDLGFAQLGCFGSDI